MPATVTFILSLRSASRAEVLKAMNAGGRRLTDGLHFISNAGYGKGWTGFINFTFDSNDRVTVIYALVDGPNGSLSNMEFIWNANGALCSDFPASRNRCNH